MFSCKSKERVLELAAADNKQYFNEIDDLMTDALRKARTAVEGRVRSLPYSITKLRVSNVHLC